MARPGYMSIYADERTQKIFHEFTQRKGIGKSTVLTEMMQTYMLAQDEELYLQLLKESLNISKTKEIISVKEDDTAINDYIFMKLGIAYMTNNREIDGEETMQAYMRAVQEHGYTWFSTMSLHSGMAKDKISFYNQAIESGEVVKVLFALGMGINDVCYSAKLQKIVSSRDEITCPGDPNTIPIEFGKEEKGKIWFKLTELQDESEIKVDMLKFRKDDGSVKNAISKSQFHFGYVYIGSES
jgi:hypothetical protein